jgi:phage FluMu protein Com
MFRSAMQLSKLACCVYLTNSQYIINEIKQIKCLEINEIYSKEFVCIYIWYSNLEKPSFNNSHHLLIL